MTPTKFNPIFTIAICENCGHEIELSKTTCHNCNYDYTHYLNYNK